MVERVISSVSLAVHAIFRIMEKYEHIPRIDVPSLINPCIYQVNIGERIYMVVDQDNVVSYCIGVRELRDMDTRYQKN